MKHQNTDLNIFDIAEPIETTETVYIFCLALPFRILKSLLARKLYTIL